MIPLSRPRPSTLFRCVALAVGALAPALARAQEPAPHAARLHPQMLRLLAERGPSKGWVFLADKGITGPVARTDALAEASDRLSDRALRRRAARRTEPGIVDERDAAVLASHVDALRATGAEVVVESRWLNAVSVRGTLRQFEAIADLPFVDRIEPVRRGVLIDGGAVPDAGEVDAGSAGTRAAMGGFYGNSEAQLDQIGLLDMHARGFTGDGVVIGILDTGFHRGHEGFNQLGHVVDVLAEYDFVDDDPNTDIEGGDDSSQHSHGTYILGTIGAYLPGSVVGGAYDASFVLAKTEDITNEYQQEEDFYVAGLEFVEAEGADVATSSLGYIDWYTQSDLDGVTAVTTLAVNIATSNGLFCSTAAGNAGHDSNPSTSSLIAPADAFEVITVGASDEFGATVSFSSDGPSADGRVKPELHARGLDTATVCAFTDVGCTTFVSGTSLSTPLMGALLACMVQAHPDFTVGQMRERLFRTGDYFVANGVFDPELVRGYGIPNADEAAFDCNGNGIDDPIDLLSGASCDCNGNGWPDECDIADGVSQDVDLDGRPDECGSLLTASPSVVSLAAGGAQSFCLDAGTGQASRVYLLLGTTSGTAPGVSVGGTHLPLNLDAYLVRTFARSTSPIVGGYGVLDAQGGATASLTIPPGSSLFLAGSTVHHAAIVLDPRVPPGGGAGKADARPSTVGLVTNAVALSVVP